MNEPTPEFAIFQNSRTKQTAIWTKENRWIKCREDEYPAMSLLVQLIRTADDPERIMKKIIKELDM
tara:strand:+ start:807 stop:1004 length:198 start_codon:yes stop_codon:yes gene_type:complete